MNALGQPSLPRETRATDSCSPRRHTRRSSSRRSAPARRLPTRSTPSSTRRPSRSSPRPGRSPVSGRLRARHGPRLRCPMRSWSRPPPTLGRPRPTTDAAGRASGSGSESIGRVRLSNSDATLVVLASTCMLRCCESAKQLPADGGPRETTTSASRVAGRSPCRPDLRRRLHLDEPGAQVVLTEREDGVVELTAALPIRADQRWFWTDRWQSMEREVDEHVAAGRTTTFADPDELLAHLDASLGDEPLGDSRAVKRTKRPGMRPG